MRPLAEEFGDGNLIHVLWEIGRLSTHDVIAIFNSDDVRAVLQGCCFDRVVIRDVVDVVDVSDFATLISFSHFNNISLEAYDLPVLHGSDG